MFSLHTTSLLTQQAPPADAPLPKKRVGQRTHHGQQGKHTPGDQRRRHAGDDDDDDDDDKDDPEPTDEEYEAARLNFLALANLGPASSKANGPVVVPPPIQLPRRALDALAAYVNKAADSAGAGRTAVEDGSAQTFVSVPDVIFATGADHTRRIRQLLDSVHKMLRFATRPPVSGLQQILWSVAASPPWPTASGRAGTSLAEMTEWMRIYLTATAVSVVVLTPSRLVVLGQFLYEGTLPVLALVWHGDTARLLAPSSSTVMEPSSGRESFAPTTAAATSMPPPPPRLPCLRLLSVLSNEVREAKGCWSYVGYTLADAALLDYGGH